MRIEVTEGRVANQTPKHGPGERRYGSSEATPSLWTAMKARADMTLWRRTQRRERIVRTDANRDRNRPGFSLSLLPPVMLRSA